ncbi:DUF2617 family protein [Luteipulveratus halotolerans]|uniref:DUF2617 domain-containing protein n=1 Tax=Luteipulveratus halotolerans TaxID=1631356 RepID=A0A0L6CG16_9MICO|nr:DUF2617 family protein [Luteipulveratus halotolerans]KNX36747.1 hypothetical protein VV01_05665 [Luteipulveratus halotolerans]
MHHLLELGYVDTRAEDLRWSLAHPVLPALAHARPADAPVALRVLGASHQVVVDGPGLPALVETVAYLPGVDERLPRPGVRTTAGSGRWTYEMTTQVDVLTGRDLSARVAELLGDLDGRTGALSAAFPGDALAVTALLAEPEPEGAAWRTWHAYPQHGQLVHTRTRIRPTGRDAHHEESSCDVR